MSPSLFFSLCICKKIGGIIICTQISIQKRSHLKNYSLKILFGKNLVNYNEMKQRLVIRLFEFLIVWERNKQSVFQKGYFLKNVNNNVQILILFLLSTDDYWLATPIGGTL